ncbi:MAG: hypothetical protein RIR70_1241 [Pseudomonadota bacterium]|jgi:hypothetical protein
MLMAICRVSGRWRSLATQALTRTLFASLVVSLSLPGCHTLTRDPRDPVVPKQPERMKTVTDDGTDAELQLETEFSARDAFLLRPTNESDPLPNIELNNISITESGVYDAVQAIAKIARLGLSIEGGAKGMERYGATATFGLSGSLPDVMERLSNSLGFFYSVNNGILTIVPEEQFVIEMPPSLHEDNLAGITNTLQYLGARDIFLDRLNRSLTFRANKKALAGVSAYVQRVRQTRSLLLFDVHVYQVDLSDSKESGIQWNRFAFSDAASGSGSATTGTTGTGLGAGATVGGTTTTTATAAANSTTFARSGGFGVGAVLSGPKFNIDALVNFLRTQGTVKNISQPRMALLTGSKGSLRVGQATTYVSKVGTNVSANLNQVTVETQNLQTGFELTLFGEEHDGTIYTRVQMTLSDLVKFNRFTALGTDLTLPQTADREVRTAIRARPGDTILLGGITVSKDSIDVSNGITASTRNGDTSRSELVIALKPKIVRFNAAKDKATAAAVQNANPVVQDQPVDNPFRGNVGRPYSVVEPREPITSAKQQRGADQEGWVGVPQ